MSVLPRRFLERAWCRLGRKCKEHRDLLSYKHAVADLWAPSWAVRDLPAIDSCCNGSADDLWPRRLVLVHTVCQNFPPHLPLRWVPKKKASKMGNFVSTYLREKSRPQNVHENGFAPVSATGRAPVFVSYILSSEVLVDKQLAKKKNNQAGRRRGPAHVGFDGASGVRRDGTPVRKSCTGASFRKTPLTLLLLLEGCSTASHKPPKGAVGFG